MKNNANSKIHFNNPFVGLRAFTEDDSLLFFGRRKQTIEIMKLLREKHFVAIVGGSGCGKSSLIRAGLIPNLKAGFMVGDRSRWNVATMKPGDHPIRNLTTSLLKAMSSSTSSIDNIETIDLHDSPEFIIDLLEKSTDSNTLLLVDQFEEVFRFNNYFGSEENQLEAVEFVSTLLNLSQRKNLPIYIVITMRSDFLGDCDSFYGLPEAMNQCQYLVPRLTREQRCQAIEGPIHLAGASITGRLLDLLLNDTGNQPDHLPVMQHALMRTYEKWKQTTDSEIDLNHYESIGAMKDALQLDAEAALSGLNENELQTTKRIFQALTNKDAHNRYISRPLHVSDLSSITGEPSEKILDITKRLCEDGRSFLYITNDKDPLINISHEVLIYRWKKLREWAETESNSKAMLLRITDAAERNQEGIAEYLRGLDLQSSLEWWDKQKPNKAWAKLYRIDNAGYELANRFLQRSKTNERQDKQMKLEEYARATIYSQIGGKIIDVFQAMNIQAAFLAYPEPEGQPEKKELLLREKNQSFNDLYKYLKTATTQLQPYIYLAQQDSIIDPDRYEIVSITDSIKHAFKQKITPPIPDVHLPSSDISINTDRNILKFIFEDIIQNIPRAKVSGEKLIITFSHASDKQLAEICFATESKTAQEDLNTSLTGFSDVKGGGLSLSQALTEAIGGSFIIDSKSKHGTIIKIFIPTSYT